MFPCEFCENSRNTFFTEQIRTTSFDDMFEKKLLLLHLLNLREISPRDFNNSRLQIRFQTSHLLVEDTVA